MPAPRGPACGSAWAAARSPPFPRPQDRPGGRAEGARHARCGQHVAGQQRAGHRPQQLCLLGADDTEHRKFLVTEIDRPVVARPREHLLEMADAETHLGAEGGGEQLARGLGGVDRRSASSRQLSQLPQFSGGSSPKWRSRIARRQPAVSTKLGKRVQPLALACPPIRLDLGLDPAAGAGESPPRPRTARPRPARRRGRRGRSPDNRPRSISGCRHGRRSARRACRCPCRRRWSPPSPSLRS